MGPAKMLASHAGRAARGPGVFGVFKCLASTFPPCRESTCTCTSSLTATARLSLDDELLAASAKYFKADNERAPTVEQVAEYYRERRFAAVVFTVDATTATGHPGLSSEEMADRAAAHADVLIPFGSVDPLAGEAAVRRARRLITDHGVRGFKFHPSLQAFSPDDRSYYPLYSVIEEAGLPAVFHTGQTGIGPACPADAGSSCGCPTRCCSTTWPPTSPACRSSWPTRRCPGRTRRSRSPPTRPTCTSTCPAGRPSTSHPTWSARPVRCCRTRCCSAPTTRC